jgi:hypothetical protein
MSYDEDGTYWPNEDDVKAGIDALPPLSMTVRNHTPVVEYREQYHLSRTAHTYSIGDLDFWYVGKILSEDREIVVLECSANTFLLPFYKSHSGLESWRLYVREGGSYHKGPDYVQSNLMYIPLQLWVNEHYQVMPSLSFETIYYDRPMEYAFFNAIDNFRRQTNEVRLSEDVAQSVFQTYKERNLFSDYLSSPTCGHLSTLSSTEENSQQLSRVVSTLFEAGEETPMARVYSKVEMDAHLQFYQEIIRVPMKSKIPFFPDSTLYYSLYNMVYQREHIHVECKKYRIPLFLGEDKCTSFGLFSSYLTIGNYVCKVLDYNSQIAPFISNEYRCTSSYTFIGHLYNDLYPFPPHQSTLVTNQLDPTMNAFGFTRKVVSVVSEQGRRLRKTMKKTKRKNRSKNK